ncbi:MULTISPECIES: hypothetical protein [Rhizobium]|uniref:Uncharacterized protein n=1 Tax=Rhizobium paranaense TaxID=1650438 RepID=A0A7W9D4G7_9HYPH|nr:hypothetical protein [Rhizobium paranaense]MBB5577235.1 hypothetical protein [Rhizobium paranaense]
MSAKTTTNAIPLNITLTPTEIRALKLASDGDLYPQDAKRWTHLNATVTYARSDRFKERPIKVKFVTTTTLEQLRDYGLLRSLEPDIGSSEPVHAITMAGKMWLLKHK